MKYLILFFTSLTLFSASSHGLATEDSVENTEKPRILAPYPKDIKLAYMRACVGETRALIPHCKCMLKEMEGRYTLDEMKKIVSAPKAQKAKYARALSQRCAGKK